MRVYGATAHGEACHASMHAPRARRYTRPHAHAYERTRVRAHTLTHTRFRKRARNVRVRQRSLARTWSAYAANKTKSMNARRKTGVRLKIRPAPDIRNFLARMVRIQ